ncbi:MAG: hypothetical protein QNJ61_13335 [Desulfobacterales bacterium]|nr:hypothetical protein [Desulfobacterales bacterium]
MRNVASHESNFGKWSCGLIIVASMIPFLLPPVVAEAGSSVKITPERTITGGLTIASPEVGIALTVPAGFSGAYDPDLWGIILASPKAGTRLGIWGASQATVDELVARVGEVLAEQGIEVIGEESRQTAPDGFDARFTALTAEGPALLLASLRTGDHGNAAAVVGLGRPADVDRLQTSVGAVVGSLSWRRPQAHDWRARLAGLRLSGGGSHSDYSPGGAGGGGSGASASQTTMDFCRDGTYGFESHSETFVSIAGASASSTSGDAHQGQWALVADLAGRAILVLSASDGREFFWPIEETDQGARVNGRSYASQASPLCR